MGLNVVSVILVKGITIEAHLSEDPGPHAVFLLLCAKGWKGVGISRMVVVVVD